MKTCIQTRWSAIRPGERSSLLRLRFAMLLLVWFGCAGALLAAESIVLTEEIPIGFLPVDWVAAAMKKTLSPQGAYSLVPGAAVRISDDRARIDATRRELAALQQAPAIVPIEITFATMARRTVERSSTQPGVLEREIPIPQQFDPPRIVSNPRGGFTVVPAQPRDFRTRSFGPGTVVNPSGTGYTTLTPEVSTSETVSVAAAKPRRFVLSAVPGKTVTVTVLAAATDPPGLRALARRLGAIGDAEPEWAGASTELLVTPQVSGSALLMTIVPQIAIAGAPGGPPARRIPIRTCAASVLSAREARASTGLLPHTDPEFYRTFVGIPQATDETYTSMTVVSEIRYMGGPPR